MSGEPPEAAAVRAVLGRSDEPLRFDGGSVVDGPTSAWQVIPLPLGFGESPVVFIVGPLGGEDPEQLVRVADIPGRGFTVLQGIEPLETLLAAYPALPPRTIATLAALSLGLPGGERVLVGDEVDDALAERAAEVPPELRTLDFKPAADGAWTLAFLTSRLHKSPPDSRWHYTVARWHVWRDPAGSLTWRRDVVLDSVILERYA